MTKSDKNQKQLWKLIQKNELYNIEIFLKSISEDTALLVNKRHRASGDSVIHLSCRHGFLSIVDYFHKTWKIALELRNLDVKTPLHESCAGGHFDVAKYLLERDVIVDPFKISDWTPLMLACTKEMNSSIVQLLIDNGANVQLTNKDGWNCFHIACRTGDAQLVEYLLTIDSFLWMAVSNNERTPFHTAALHGRDDVLKIILQKCDFQLNVVDSCGSTPLMDAIKGDHLSTCKLLVRAGASGCMIDRLGKNALHIAAECNRTDVIEYLVKECCMDPNVISGDVGMAIVTLTAIEWARKENQFDAIQVLKKLGAKDS